MSTRINTFPGRPPRTPEEQQVYNGTLRGLQRSGKGFASRSGSAVPETAIERQARLDTEAVEAYFGSRFAGSAERPDTSANPAMAARLYIDKGFGRSADVPRPSGPVLDAYETVRKGFATSGR